MRADTLKHQESPNILVFLLIILVILGVLWVAGVQNGEHSVIKHGADAIQIHEILDDSCRGSHNQWHSRSWRTPNKFFQTCQLDDGRWGFRVIDKIKGVWHEKTSFVPGDVSYTHLVEYLSGIARIVR